VAELYRFFDSVDGEDERFYTADEFAEYFRQVISSGILNGGNNLQVICSGTDMNISILPGYAWLEGYLYKIDTEPLVLTLDAAHSELDRIDRVVIRLDKRLEHRYIRAFILKGTPAENPIPSDITRDENTYELSLAQVRVIGGRSLVAQSEITDERLNTQVCGLANSLVTADTTDIFNQFNDYLNSYKTEKDSEYNAWVAGIQNTWDTWFAGQQAEGFLTGADKGAPGGVASLDGQGNVPLQQLGNIDITNIKKKFDSVEEGLLKNDLVEIKDGLIKRVDFGNPFTKLDDNSDRYKEGSMISENYSHNLLIEALSEDTFMVHYLQFQNNLPAVRIGKWIPGEVSPNNIEWGNALTYHTSAVTRQQLIKLLNGDAILIALVGGVTTVYYLDINVADKTVSIGYSQSLNNGTNSNYAESAFIESNRILVVYTDTPNNAYVCGQVINIDTVNKKFTIGGKYTLVTDTSTHPQVALNNDGNGVLAWRNSSNQLKAVPVTISEDVINNGTSYTVQTTAITHSIGSFYHNGFYHFVSEISSKPALSFHVLSISGNNIVVDNIKDTKPVARFQSSFLGEKDYCLRKYGDQVCIIMYYTSSYNYKSELLACYNASNLGLNFVSPIGTRSGYSNRKSACLSILDDNVFIISCFEGYATLQLYRTKVKNSGQFNIFNFMGLLASMNEYGRIVKLSDDRIAILMIGAREDNTLDNDYYSIFFYEYNDGVWQMVASHEFKTDNQSTNTYATSIDERSIVVVFDGYRNVYPTGYKRHLYFIRLNQDHSVYLNQNTNYTLPDDKMFSNGSLFKTTDNSLLFVYSKSGEAPINQKIYIQNITITNLDKTNPTIAYGGESSRQLMTPGANYIYHLAANKINDSTIVVIGNWYNTVSKVNEIRWLTLNITGTSAHFGNTGPIMNNLDFISPSGGSDFFVLPIGNGRFIFVCRADILWGSYSLIAGLGVVSDKSLHVEIKSLIHLWVNGVAYYPSGIYYKEGLVYINITTGTDTVAVAVSVANDRLRLQWGNYVPTMPFPSNSIQKHCYNEPLEIGGKLLLPIIVNGTSNQYNTYGFLELERQPTDLKNILGLYRGGGEVAFSGYVDGFEGLIPGKDYYLEPEDLSITDKESIFKVGKALSETELLLCMEVL